jgi:hypothetical protein
VLNQQVDHRNNRLHHHPVCHRYNHQVLLLVNQQSCPRQLRHPCQPSIV